MLEGALGRVTMVSRSNMEVLLDLGHHIRDNRGHFLGDYRCLLAARVSRTTMLTESRHAESQKITRLQDMVEWIK
jgi:hypothetical protein